MGPGSNLLGKRNYLRLLTLWDSAGGRVMNWEWNEISNFGSLRERDCFVA
jgi:hypothetical protein